MELSFHSPIRNLLRVCVTQMGKIFDGVDHLIERSEAIRLNELRIFASVTITQQGDRKSQPIPLELFHR